MTLNLFHRAAVEAAQRAGIPEPRALLAPVDERIAQLEQAFNYVHVTVDTHFVPEDCECGEETTAVRVYGDPIHDEHVDSPITITEVGMRCALSTHGPIRRAGSEAGTDSDIKIEVCG